MRRQEYSYPAGAAAEGECETESPGGVSLPSDRDGGAVAGADAGATAQV